MFKFLFSSLLLICLALPLPCWSLTSTNDATLRLQIPHSFGIMIDQGKTDLKKKVWDNSIFDLEKIESSSSISTQSMSYSSETQKITGGWYWSVSPTSIDFGKHDPNWNNFSESGDPYIITVYCFTNQNDYWHLSMKCESELRKFVGDPTPLKFVSEDGNWSNFGWEFTEFSEYGNNGVGEYKGKKGDTIYRPNENLDTMNHHTTEERILYNSAWKETGANVIFWNGLQIPFDQAATNEGENYSTKIILTFYAE